MTSPALRVDVPGPADRAYDVFVGQGLLDQLGERVAAAMPAYRYVVISDDRVGELYGRAALRALTGAGQRAALYTFPAGEASKVRETWAGLTDRMLHDGVGRDAAVVALGGGVSGDLAGFVASTYMRGIPYAAVPTSLLAMLDSGVGGKTGVDTPAAKNAVGTFHHPRIVIVDPDALRTLPERDRRAGLAEAVKAAAIRDVSLFAWIESNAAALRDGDLAVASTLIERCLRIKAEIVSSDPEEAGPRELLNFGHTAGHALESLSGYSLLHGEAVAAGMRIEARLGEAIGVTEAGTAERLDHALGGCGVPDALEAFEPRGGLTARGLAAVASADKKARRGEVRWVFLRAIGEVARDSDTSWSHALTRDDLLAHLDKALRTAANVRDSAP